MCVFLETILQFLGNSRTVAHPPTEKPVEINCISATWLVCFADTNVLRMCGHGFGRASGHGIGRSSRRGLVGCDCISDHIPISLSFPEILHSTVLVLKTVLIQFLMHLSCTCNLKCMIVKIVFLVSPVSVVIYARRSAACPRCLTESSFPLSPLTSVATLVNIRNATSCPHPPPETAGAPKLLL